MSSSNASHNRINLGRILARLEKIVLVEDGNRGGTGGGLKDKSWWEVRRLSEDAKFARDLLDNVAGEERESGSGEGTSTTLSQYEALLNKISMALVLAQPTIPSLSHTPTYTLPPVPQTFNTPSLSSPSLATASSSLSIPPVSSSIPMSSPTSLPEETNLIPSGILPSSPTASTTTFRDALPPSPSVASARRASLSARDQLIPPSSKPTTTRKDSLDEKQEDEDEDTSGWGFQEKEPEKEKEDGGGIVGSTSRLHDELTEQLAQMSVQLRKNALHFSQSLEAEKPLLEQGSALLESNFTRMTNSAFRLGGVSTKGRSNTWLVLGACLVVGLAWLWMYLIIRMT